jgi:hypothetical protein
MFVIHILFYVFDVAMVAGKSEIIVFLSIDVLRVISSIIASVVAWLTYVYLGFGFDCGIDSLSTTWRFSNGDWFGDWFGFVW